MKHLQHLSILITMLGSQPLAAQSENDSVIYYTLELEATFQISETGDTIYDVFLLIENSDLVRMEELIILSTKWDKSISLNSDSISINESIEQGELTTRINVGRGENPIQWMVTAQNGFNEQLLFKNRGELLSRAPRSFPSPIPPVKRVRDPRKEMLDKESTLPANL